MDHVWWHADLDLILAWLEDFEERPVDAIKWWEQQKAAALQCFRSLPMSEDGEWDPEFKINPVEDLIQRPTYETMWVMGEESESEEWMDLDDDDGGRSDVDGESAPELYDDSMDLSDADGESTPELYDDSMDISDADPEYTSELGLMDLDDEGRLMNHCYGHPYPFSSSDIGLPCLRSSPTRV
ncbi:hypothetical protein B0H10DRAFT_2211404 [Mycena sp. CBHHK59/15]|nr:hypothetical protein B0H10DRAFT_2211404 [Mycena sp. CBHHK59/15]